MFSVFTLNLSLKQVHTLNLSLTLLIVSVIICDLKKVHREWKLLLIVVSNACYHPASRNGEKDSRSFTERFTFYV